MQPKSCPACPHLGPAAVLLLARSAHGSRPPRCGAFAVLLLNVRSIPDVGQTLSLHRVWVAGCAPQTPFSVKTREKGCWVHAKVWLGVGVSCSQSVLSGSCSGRKWTGSRLLSFAIGFGRGSLSACVGSRFLDQMQLSVCCVLPSAPYWAWFSVLVPTLSA